MRCAAVILMLCASFAVLWVGGWSLSAQELTQHYGRKQADLGPRALGLVQLSTTGKARLTPIVIMINGKFYDAASYKAMPVPLALDFGVVYEAFKTGVSQGLFTVTQPGQLNHNWIAEGTWLPAGMKGPETTKKYAPPVIDDDSRDNRPTLHRRAGGEADKNEEKPAANSTAASSTPPSTSASTQPPASSPSSTQTASAPNGSTSGSSSSTSKDTNSSATKASAPAASRSSASDVEPINDPNRPILRRGKPDPNAHHEPFVDFDALEVAPAKNSSGGATTPATAPKAAANVQTFAAVSDAGGPDPRPYTYDLKPAEEAIYRNKMEELAATLVKLPARQTAPSQASSTATAKSASSAKKSAAVSSAKPKPQFDNVNLRVFDLSNSNEPVLVLSALIPLPSSATSGSQVPQEITLVARTNLEGELQKLFFAQTDSRHLDVSPRMELIDAVDADGDGRGELLFREISDAGSGYAIYRVTADQLYPLYRGAP